MTTATATKTSYPYVSLPAWKALRKKFQERPPTTPVNAAYLKAVLQFDTDDAGATVASSLKRIGFINDSGMLTDRAYRWRDDTQYKSVCDEILEEVYPPALRDAFHSPDAALADVSRWFANDTHKGKAAAEKSARFYLMLLRGDISQLESEPKPKAPKTTKAGLEAAGRRSKPSLAEGTSEARPTVAGQATESSPNRDEPPHRAGERSQTIRTVTPSVHLDFQIHIAPDSSPQVIDQIFESMAKHLRSLLSEAGE